MSTAIIIPARWASKRFPGKPLAELCGKPILEHVWEIAAAVCARHEDCYALVATETRDAEDGGSGKILDFCKDRGIPVMETPASCRSGSDRAWAAVQKLETAEDAKIDVVINLQGDNPFCPPVFLDSLISAFRRHPETLVATPYVKLTWGMLDRFREAKRESPMSGTSVILKKDGTAHWFSKNVIPAIRNEASLREKTPVSPVCRHVGLYAYRPAALAFFSAAPAGEYEQLEQLEQLRFLENGIPVRMVEVVYPQGYQATSGIDSPEDLRRAERGMTQG